MEIIIWNEIERKEKKRKRQFLKDRWKYRRRRVLLRYLGKGGGTAAFSRKVQIPGKHRLATLVSTERRGIDRGPQRLKHPNLLLQVSPSSSRLNNLQDPRPLHPFTAAPANNTPEFHPIIKANQNACFSFTTLPRISTRCTDFSIRSRTINISSSFR